VGGKDNRVLAMDIARNDTELFVVTENGYGKRTPVSDYPVKGRGTKGVLTIRITEKKGGLAGALIVNPHQDLLFISQNGMVQRTGVGGISQMGRSTQGVKVMNIKDDDRVSAVALAAESDDESPVSDENPDQIEIESSTDVDPSMDGASEDGASADGAGPDEVDE
jgi:DNA gyrase subunit A